MEYFEHLTREVVRELEYEVISLNARVYLSKYFEQFLEDIYLKNHIINEARNTLGMPLYVLESQDDTFELIEYSWHNAEFKLVFRRLNTSQLLDLVISLFSILKIDFSCIEDLNNLFASEGNSFRFEMKKLEFGTSTDQIDVKVSPIGEIEESESEPYHNNIRLLVSRMDRSLEGKDFANVLHASASIFETLAKQVVNIPTVQNQTLASFFERYRRNSNLPDVILDYILNIYRDRNTTPLAGHGNLESPGICEKDAVLLVNLTKAFLKVEHTLSLRVDPINPESRHSDPVVSSEVSSQT